MQPATQIELVQAGGNAPRRSHERGKSRSTRVVRNLVFAPLLTVIASSWLASCFWQAPGETVVAARPAEVDALPTGYEQLVETLEQLKRCWVPADRQRLQESLLDRRDELATPLLWMLERPTHPRFGEAATLASLIDLEEGLELLHAAAEHERAEVRAAAARALEPMDPLPASRIIDLIHDEEKVAQLAGLAIAESREDKPVTLTIAAIQGLAAPDAEVRDLAWRALPDQVPAEAAADLVSLVDHPGAAALVIQALGRLEPGERTALVVVEQLESLPSEHQAMLLSTLGAMAGEQRVRDRLWQIALGNGDPDLRTLALRSLDACAGGDASRLPADLSDWEPTMRYYAARMKLREGDVAGLPLLLDLAVLEGPEHSFARAGARRILARMSRMAPHSDIEAFRAWVRTQDRIVDTGLPPAAPI